MMPNVCFFHTWTEHYSPRTTRSVKRWYTACGYTHTLSWLPGKHGTWYIYKPGEGVEIEEENERRTTTHFVTSLLWTTSCKMCLVSATYTFAASKNRLSGGL